MLGSGIAFAAGSQSTGQLESGGVVIRVIGHLGDEMGELVIFRCFGGQRQRGAGADNKFILRIGRHRFERGSCRLRFATRQQRQGITRHQIMAIRHLAGHRSQHGDGVFMGAGRSCFCCRCDQLADLLLQRGLVIAGRDARQQLVNELCQLRFRQGALEAINRAAIKEGIDGGDGLDAELGGQRLVLVHIDLDQRHLGCTGCNQSFQRRPQRLARAAPLRPEVDQHQCRLGRLDHVAPEGFDAGLFGGGIGNAGQGVMLPCVVVRAIWGRGRRFAKTALAHRAQETSGEKGACKSKAPGARRPILNDRRAGVAQG